LTLLAAADFRRCLLVRNATPSKEGTLSATPNPLSTCAPVESPDELDEVEVAGGEEVDVAEVDRMLLMMLEKSLNRMRQWLFE